MHMHMLQTEIVALSLFLTLSIDVAAKIPVAAPAQAITVDDREHTIYTSYMEQGKVLKIDGKTNSI